MTDYDALSRLFLCTVYLTSGSLETTAYQFCLLAHKGNKKSQLALQDKRNWYQKLMNVVPDDGECDCSFWNVLCLPADCESPCLRNI